MYYLYTLDAARVMHKASWADGGHICNTRKESVENVAKARSLQDGKVYTIDQQSNLDMTVDGKPVGQSMRGTDAKVPPLY